MRDLLLCRNSAVWLLLTGATLYSWSVGRGPMRFDGDGAALSILVVTIVKARFVMLDFMELREAPRPMRTAAEAWLSGLCAALILLYTGGVDHWLP